MDRDSIETEIARILGDLLLEGTVDAGSSTEIGDTELVFAEANQLRGREVYMTSGESYAQARTVASYAVGTIGVTPAFTIAPTTGDQYNVYDKYTHSDYLGAIQEAMRQARKINLMDMVATLEIVATQWEYVVPSGFKYINTMRFVPSGHTDYDLDNRDPVPRLGWVVRPDPAGTRRICFDPRYINLDDYDEDLLIIQGQRMPVALASGTTNTEVGDSYLIAKAASILLAQNIADEASMAKYRIHADEAARLERAIFRYARPNSVLVSEDLP